MISKKSLPVMRFGGQKFKNCISIFSETVKDIYKIFGDGRSLDWGVHVGLWMSSVTSGPDRK